ncbi:23S rRNA (uracil(1939)-C(5))-methyltransferase RlmD [Gallaecimonas mangrovi]|uniref:23S rRNA (uracil(1939)-C(5))-methyltransferase RlmD n=1 Tax=Gallaecimonas mangrovi TaxID=2291597 RepID=UPI000E206C2D|nr:23S rRNA (uracil(1939)-C(5))-methyltransferase RlmD [Gallaecimonas mangrovi]
MHNAAEIFEVTGLTEKGDGIAQLGPRQIFISGALPGETVSARLTDIKPRYAQAEMISVLDASKQRVAAFCKHHQCGGCQIAHLDYQAQLQLKRQRLVAALTKAGLTPAVAPCLGMATPLGFRNKALYSVQESGGGFEIGFYKKHSHQLVAADDCPVQGAKVSALLTQVRQWMQAFAISGYNEAKHSGQVRGIMVREGRNSGQWMLVLVALTAHLPGLDDLRQRFREHCPWLSTLVLNINAEPGNRVLGFQEQVLMGPGYIEEQLAALRFHVSAQSFFQINPSQTEQLYAKALEFAELTGKERVFDLYCGAGSISLFLAAKAKEVIGVEVVAQAVADAKTNAALNGVENAHFYLGKAEQVVPALYQQGIRADVVVVDPPRKGCDSALLNTLVAMAPKTLVYVSCDVDSLARDLVILCQQGFVVDKVQPLDMFPHSLHVETLARLTYKQ